MDTDQTNPAPMHKDQLGYLRSQIIKTYLFLISHTEHDPQRSYHHHPDSQTPAIFHTSHHECLLLAKGVVQNLGLLKSSLTLSKVAVQRIKTGSPDNLKVISRFFPPPFR